MGGIAVFLALIALSLQTGPTPEPPAPKPGPAHAALLDRARSASDGRALAETLLSATTAASTAERDGDWIGAAACHSACALILVKQSRPRDASAAWTRAALAWERAGDGPARIRALGEAAQVLIAEKLEGARPLLDQALAAGKAETARPLTAAEALFAVGVALSNGRKPDMAPDFAQAGMAVRERLGCEPPAIAQALEYLGAFEIRARHMPDAESCYRRALEIYERRSRESADVARALHGLAQAVSGWGRYDYAAAKQYYGRAYAIRQKLAPDSVPVADSVRALGDTAYNQGEYAAAEVHYVRALAIYGNLAPGCETMARCLCHHAMAAYQQSKIAEAESRHRQALALFTQLDTRSADMALNLQGLGDALFSAGDLTEAYACYRRALEIREYLSPGSLEVAESLNQLGGISWARGDLPAAARSFERAIDIPGRLGYQVEEGEYLSRLAVVVKAQGHPGTAETYLKRALILVERWLPGSLNVAGVLTRLGDLYLSRGAPVGAEAYYRRAQAIQRNLAPGSLEEAHTLHGLGGAAQRMGDLVAARTHYLEAMAIREKLAPGSLEAAESLQSLAGLDMAQKRWSQAAAQLEQAAAIVEAQRGQIANPEARAMLMERNAGPFDDLLVAYVRMGRSGKAYETLERRQARSLVDAVSERGHGATTDLALGAPPQLVQKRRGLVLERLACMKRQSSPPAAGLRAVADVDADLRQVEDDIRRAAPGFSGLRYPKPPTLAQAQAALDPGTLLLAYAVQERETILFAVTRTVCRAYRVPMGSARLASRVGALRGALTTPDAAYTAAAEAVFGSLVRPAWKEAAAASRLLISPDGPLHLLPFSALVASRRGTRPVHLAELKPIHTVASLGLYRLVRAMRRAPAAGKVVALADPAYAAGPGVASSPMQAHTLAAQEVGSRGLRLNPLPATRKQVGSLRELYGDRVVALVGRNATIAALKRECVDARVVHLACHGLADNVDPLSSALALSPGPGDDGLLFAFEVLQSVRLRRTDLVMLSACSTGLGRNTRSEGVVGLTRALIYAGSRTVGTTLWSVELDSTTALMQSFYHAWNSGAAKDEALRRAQLAVMRQDRWRHPYYWAGLQLVGDWK
jgi:CHAT domain-containing protein